MRFRFCLLALFVAVGSFSSVVDAGLTIDLDFSDFQIDAPSDGGTVLGGASLSQAEDVIRAAARQWESEFENQSSRLGFAVDGNIRQPIKFQWSSLSGGARARSVAGFDPNTLELNGATVTLDNDGASGFPYVLQFYVDPDATNDTEWAKTSDRSLSFSMIDMNVEDVRYEATNNARARQHTDLYSVALREIGQSLGLIDGYPPLVDALSSDGSELQLASGAFAGAAIPFDDTFTDFTIVTPGDGDFPFDPGPNASIEPFNYQPNLLGRSLLPGIRTQITDVDAAIIGQVLGFEVVAVPEPSSCAAFAIVTLGLFINRRQRLR